MGKLFARSNLNYSPKYMNAVNKWLTNGTLVDCNILQNNMNLESEGPVTDSIARTTSKEWIFSKKI